VVVFGGGSFGTAMGTSLAHKKADLDVVLLLRDPYLCHDINSKHINSKYLAVSPGAEAVLYCCWFFVYISSCCWMYCWLLGAYGGLHTGLHGYVAGTTLL